MMVVCSPQGVTTISAVFLMLIKLLGDDPSLPYQEMDTERASKLGALTVVLN
jgi:hypothetical protein